MSVIENPYSFVVCSCSTGPWLAEDRIIYSAWSVPCL